MPVEISETQDSGARTSNRDIVSSTGTRIFNVVATNDDGSADSSFVPGNATFAVGISFGDTHPENSLLRCTSISVRRVPNHPGVFRVTVNYTVNQFDPSGPDIGDDGPVYQQTVQLNFRGKFEKLWRVNANADAEPFTTDGSGVDIGGTPMDTFGEIERTTMIVKPQLQITMMRNVNIGVPTNYLSELQYFVGTRNNNNFLGAGKGKLLYVGATSRRVRDTLYEISHSFEFDQAKHQEQAPQPGVGPFGKQIQTSAGIFQNRAFPVYWVQPYPVLRDFRLLGINLRG